MDTDDETIVKKYTIVQNFVVRVKRGPEATLEFRNIYKSWANELMSLPVSCHIFFAFE